MKKIVICLVLVILFVSFFSIISSKSFALVEKRSGLIKEEISQNELKPTVDSSVVSHFSSVAVLLFVFSFALILFKLSPSPQQVFKNLAILRE